MSVSSLFQIGNKKNKLSTGWQFIFKRISNKNYSELFRFVLVYTLIYSLIFSSVFSIDLRPAYGQQYSEAEKKRALDISNDFTHLVEQFEASVSGQGGSHLKIDPFSLLQQKSYVDDTLLAWWTTHFELEEKGVVRPIPGGTKGAEGLECLSKDCKLLLKDTKGRLLKEFSVDVAYVIQMGHNLVFFRKDSATPLEDGSQILSFIDLQHYESLLGKNAPLPIFEIPIKIDKSVSHLSHQSGQLYVNGQPHLRAEDFVYLSALYGTAVSIQSNLVDPANMPGAVILANNFAEYLTRWSDHIDRSDWGQSDLNNTVKLFADLPQLEAQLSQDLNTQVLRSQPVGQFLKSIETKNVKGIAAIRKALEILLEKKSSLSSDQLAAFNRFEAALEKTVSLNGTLTALKEGIANQKSLRGAFQRFVTHLSSPDPESTNRIKNFIVGSVARVKYKLLISENSLIKGPRTVITKLYSWLAKFDLLSQVGMYGFITFAFLFPEVFSGTTEAFLKSSETMMHTLNPLTMIPTMDQAYVSGGMLTKSLIAFSGVAVSIMSVVGFYHVSQNLVRLIIDMRRPEWKGFVARQEKQHQDYLDALVQSESARRSFLAEHSPQFSPEEDAKIREYIDLLEKKVLPRQAKKKEKKLAEENSKRALQELWDYSQQANEEIVTSNPHLTSVSQSRFLWALQQFIFSFSSYNRTVLDYTGIWNAWAGFRYSGAEFLRLNIAGSSIPVFIKPKLDGLFIRLAYPNFFRVAVRDGAKEGGGARLNIPSVLNGGSRSLPQILGRWLNSAAQLAFRKISWRELKAQIERENVFESKITDIEASVATETISAAISAFTRYAKHPETLKKLFDSKGVGSISATSISEMSYANQVFISTFFDQVFEEAMRRVLAQGISQEEPLEPFTECASIGCQKLSEHTSREMQTLYDQLDREGSLDGASLDELKQMFISQMRRGQQEEELSPEAQKKEQRTGSLKGDKPFVFDLKMGPEQIKQIVAQVSADQKYLEKAGFASRTAWINPKAFVKNAKYGFISYLDPTKNKSMERYATVERQRQDPQAMARAVRQELINVFYTMPVDLAYNVILYAGVTDGPMKPIQNEFYGSASVAYASRMIYYDGMVGGTAHSLLGNAWVKLQEDQLMDSKGHYGKIPEGADVHLSFFRWWLKQYMSEGNSLAANYRRGMYLAWHNLPAAIPNISTFRYAFLGRVDLSLLLMGYLYHFFTPFIALSYKIEQSFEMAAAGYEARNIPRPWLSHPRTQEFLQAANNYHRIKFNVLRDLIFNPLNAWTANMQVTGTETSGPRAMLRSILGGTLPDEVVINAIDSLANQVKDIPVVGHAAQGAANLCEQLLSNGNYREFTKINRYGP